MDQSQKGNGAKSGVTQCVVLRHTLPDGSQHLDWMIERADIGVELITFRLAVGTDVSKPGEWRAERIGDHRRDYLTYEGPVSGGRGRVDGLGRYGVVQLAVSESHILVVLEQSRGVGRMKWSGEREVEPHWRFVGVVC